MTAAHDKGHDFELLIAREIRRKGLDKSAKRMHRSGAIDHRKSDIFTELPYSIEAKAQERVELWAWWTQARTQARMGLPPVLVVGGANRSPVVIMDLNTFLDLEKVRQEYMADIPERKPLGQKS